MLVLLSGLWGKLAMVAPILTCPAMMWEPLTIPNTMSAYHDVGVMVYTGTWYGMICYESVAAMQAPLAKVYKLQ